MVNSPIDYGRKVLASSSLFPTCPLIIRAFATLLLLTFFTSLTTNYYEHVESPHLVGLQNESGNFRYNGVLTMCIDKTIATNADAQMRHLSACAIIRPSRKLL